MEKKRVVILGATGAVGTEVVNTLIASDVATSILTCGRRPMPNMDSSIVSHEVVDIFDSTTYDGLLANYDIAICTLGVGEPSKMNKEDFIKIDKTAVLDFAKACRSAGIRHFELLSSVGISIKSPSFFLRTKAELVEDLKSLEFDRLSIFQPSMILTPTNRYGMSQAITLALWPVISPLLIGSLKRYKGIKVEDLGAAMAYNITNANAGFEMLSWQQMQDIMGDSVAEVSK